MTFNTESYNNDSLSCEAFEDRVHQILDDRLTLTGDARLMNHAAQCSDCENKLLDYDCFDDSISFLKQSVIEVTCIVDDDGSGNPLRHPVAGLAFLAAMLLVCLNVFFGGLSSNRPGNLSQRPVIEEGTPVRRSPAIGQLAMATPSSNLKSFAAPKRITPDTSPFSPNFRVADNIPQLPTAPDWEVVSKRLETLEPVLTGAKKIHCTLNVTIELLRRSLAENSEPELTMGLG